MSRPVHCFRDFVGQQKEVALLRRQLAGAKEQGEPFPHTIFSGPSGVGKTLLAKTLADEYGTSLIVANGYDTHSDLAEKFQRVKWGDFVFIDEAHNLRPKAQELLYHVIDDGLVPLWDADQDNGNSDPNESFVRVLPLTVILATDQPGKLLNALDKRMELNVRLDYYPLREMREILDNLARNLGLLVSSHARNLIARVSRGLPRNTKHHLRCLRRHFTGIENEQVTIGQVRKYLQDFGIDQSGLSKTDRAYLRYLAKTKSASLESLALYLGTDIDNVRRQIEPILTRTGLITIGSGGRRLTDKGRKWADNDKH